MFKKKCYLLSVLTLILVLNLSSIANAGTIEKEPFSFNIIGYLGMEGMVGVPVPLNYSGSTMPEADTYGYDGIIFKITYQERTSCHISRILLWQELSNFGYTYNYTGLKEIPSPGIFSLEGQEFEFIVKSDRWPPMFYINGLIKIRIYTENKGDFVLSSILNYGIEKLEGWTPELRIL